MKKSKPKAEKPMTHLEAVVEGALAHRFEGTWQGIASVKSKYSYHPDICQKLKNLVLKWIDSIGVKDESGLSPVPPHLSEFARVIGVPTKVILDWGTVFPDLQEEIETLNDLNREMLVNGGLRDTYNTKITTIMLDHNHGIREKKESLLPPGTAMIPMSAVQSIQFLIQQQGLPPVALTDFQEVK